MSSTRETQDDRADFASLLRQHQTQLFGYIYSLVRDLDDADDLFQQTSLVLWDKFDQFDRSKSFVNWACGVAQFEVLNFLRTRSRKRLYFSDELNLALVETHESLEHELLEERRTALAGCMKKLRQKDRELLEACYERSASMPEVAQPGPVDSQHSQLAAPDSACSVRVCSTRCCPGGDFMNSRNELTDEFRDLIDAYCSGLIDDQGVSRLEATLVASAAARRHFVEYFHHHTEIQFAVRAGHAAEAVLDRLTRKTAEPSRPAGRFRPWLARPAARWLTGVAAGIAMASVGFAALR